MASPNLSQTSSIINTNTTFHVLFENIQLVIDDAQKINKCLLVIKCMDAGLSFINFKVACNRSKSNKATLK